MGLSGHLSVNSTATKNVAKWYMYAYVFKGRIEDGWKWSPLYLYDKLVKTFYNYYQEMVYG